ncbi:MAG: type II secretion system F family protein [Gammaproteobacteria bacterium]|nr:MAG: type II secretion system F family protein [Gammaproteobacteria bacterium]
MAQKTKAAAKPKKMPTFAWEGKDKKGNSIKGESVAANPMLVKADLRRQGITPSKVKKKSELFASANKKSIKPGDIAVFSRQLATMISSGVPIVQAFDIIGKGHDNPSMQELVMAIKNDVEQGNTLAESMAKHPRYFDELFVNLIDAGEQSGALESLLDKIATYKEKTESIKKKIKKALFYPTAVLVVAFVVTTILLIWVVPQFAELFKGFGAELPAFTKFVLALSDLFIEYWYLIFGGIILGVFAFIEAKRRSHKFNYFLDRLMIRIPIIGSILNKAAIARFARTLSTMFAAGVPLVDSLTSVAGAAGNIVYSNAILQMKDNVSTGQQLQLAMKQTNLFPSMVVQMVAIGEESGSIDTMLTKVADFYEEEVDAAVDGLSSLLEPLIMVILGVLVGGLVIAMYLPIFQLGQVVG